jgi:hypothetical protein
MSTFVIPRPRDPSSNSPPTSAWNLAIFIADDPGTVQWLTNRWEVEEVRHGTDLRRYVETVWPDFPWDAAYARFLTDYSRFCSDEQLDSTRSLEMAARCVVETEPPRSIACYRNATDEPVLHDLARRISSDEVRALQVFLRAVQPIPIARGCLHVGDRA